jgi:hypothetical protein
VGVVKLAQRRITRASMVRGASLSVTDGEGATIRIHRGCVWVTEEESFIDHVLVGGQRYTFDRPGVAIVTAHEDACVTLSAPRFGAAPVRVAVAGMTVYQRTLWQALVGALVPALTMT